MHRLPALRSLDTGLARFTGVQRGSAPNATVYHGLLVCSVQGHFFPVSCPCKRCYFEHSYMGLPVKTHAHLSRFSYWVRGMRTLNFARSWRTVLGILALVSANLSKPQYYRGFSFLPKWCARRDGLTVIFICNSLTADEAAHFFTSVILSSRLGS